ncbi:MAG: hypothetical protein WCP68_15310 [Enhydrobacter sp.]
MSKAPLRAALLALMLCGWPWLSHAQAPAERLIAPVPPDYRPAGKVSAPGSIVEIFRPPGQTDDNWTNQLMVQTSRDRVKADPSDVLRGIEKTFAASCAEPEPATIAPGKVNGYATATTLFKCPRVTATGKPETSLVHAIAGNDHMYIVHQAMRRAHTPDELKQMIRYLGTVTGCDDQASGHPCPAQKP